MRKSNQLDNAYKNAIKVAKRIAITILCCIPVMLVLIYLLRTIITSSVGQVLFFVFFMGIAVLLEEIIVRKKEKQTKAEKELHNKKDVFK